MSRARIILADDHRIVVEGLRSLLQSEFDLVGTAENGVDLVELAQRTDRMSSSRRPCRF